MLCILIDFSVNFLLCQESIYGVVAIMPLQSKKHDEGRSQDKGRLSQVCSMVGSCTAGLSCCTTNTDPWLSWKSPLNRSLLIYKDHLKLCQAFSSDNTWQFSAQKDFSEIPKVHQILGGRQKRLRYFFFFFFHHNFQLKFET